jgi:hypothetical protein
MRAVYPHADPAGSSEPDSALAPSQRTRSAELGERSAVYAMALSENVAAHADRDPHTAAFRTAHLPGGLLRLDQVDGWVSDRVREQSAEVRQARVRIPAGWNAGDALPSEVVEVFVDQLAYVAPGFDSVRQAVVAPGGVLGRLRRLATSLAAGHGWEPAQAATWVLTGITPIIGLIRITEDRENIRNNWWTAWSERITLDVHPAAMPNEVADAYSAARKRLDFRRTQGNHRARSQSIPHLVLARFVARKRARQRPASWGELRNQWNAWIVEQNDYADLKRYEYDSTFRRDAAVACKRVLYRGHYAGRGAATAAGNEDLD